MTALDRVILKFSEEMGADFISTDVVETDRISRDGNSIAGASIDPNFNTIDASTQYSMIMTLASKVCGMVGMGKVEDNLTTTDKAFIIARYLGDGSYFWVAAVSRNASLGAVRMLMDDYARQLWKVMSQ